MLPRIQAINPARIAAPFDDSNFIFELKHDGFRAVAYIEDGACRLISRKQIQYKSFGVLSNTLAGLRVKNAILDGEIICLDKFGRSQFLDLMRRRRQDEAFYAFDILCLDGVDLRRLGLVERKRILRKIIRGHDRILYAAHVESHGLKLFEAVCQKDCEGIVAKHRLAPYVSKPQTWFKVLNPEYSQKRGRREMFDKFRTQGEHDPLRETEIPS